MDASKQFCPNEACSPRGQQEQGTIIIHDRKRHRYRCKVCKHTFSVRRGTMFEGLRKPMELSVIVVTLLTYGCPIQARMHAFGLDERTVADWRTRAGVHCQQVHKEIVEQGQLDLMRVQADEIRVKGGFMLDHRIIGSYPRPSCSRARPISIFGVSFATANISILHSFTRWHW